MQTERQSEFGTQLFWYSGTITKYEATETSLPKVESIFNEHPDSYFEILSVDPEQMELIEESIKRIRKELKLE